MPPLIDGKHASSPSVVWLVMAVGAKTLWMHTNANTGVSVDTTVAEYLRRTGFGWMVREIVALDGRVTQNEEDIVTLKEQTDTNAGMIATNAGNIASNHPNIAANASSIVDNRGLISDNRRTIGKLSSDLDVVRAGVGVGLNVWH